jgi:uncharacterized membrane protein YqgA involved in biofilm formation
MWQRVAVKLPIVFFCIFAKTNKKTSVINMIGTIVNTLAVAAGGTLGLLLNKSLHPRFKEIYFQATGLFTIVIGITMVKDMQQIILVVASVAIGALIGEWMQLEMLLNRLSDKLKSRLRVGNEKFSEGLVTSFILFCIGAMTIVGAIDEGVGRSSEVLLTKSLMDGFSAILLASAYGVGVIFSSVPLFVFQGSITLLAMYAASFFSPEIIQGLSSVGGILLIGLGINILEIRKLRIVNLLPALLLVVIFIWLSSYFA